jgi:predicted transcriptional regulator of viral defense system
MISISGIKYQKELETLPFINKKQAEMLVGKRGKNLDKKLQQLKKIGYLLDLKKGMYTTTAYYEKTANGQFIEYIANNIRLPSYISLEYVLAKEGIIPEMVYPVSSITLKTTRNYSNFLGTFIYKNIKEELFFGYLEKKWENQSIYQATKAKALFDFLYLKKLTNIKQELTTDLRINWSNFSQDDLVEFTKYVRASFSSKMALILKILKNNVY